MKLSIDDRDCNLNKNLVYENSDLVKSLSKLDLLDGNRHTLLCLDREDGWQMQIGGGEKYFILIKVNFKSDENLTLLNINGDENIMIELCTGGQFADFPNNIVVDKKVVINAISLFYKKNEEILDWILD